MTQAWDFITANILWGVDPPESVLIEGIDGIKYQFFSNRAANALHVAGVKTLAELAAMSEAELLRLPNFGRKSLQEIKQAVKYYGLELRQ
jgi:DNA-directed RNA polymerase alpha subunit